jgi:phosphoglycolate phosphatase
MKLLLFDVDATLILTGGAGLRALARAFKTLYGVEDAMNGISPSGKTDPSIVREIFLRKLAEVQLIESKIPDVLEAYITYLHEEVESAKTYRILPGIAELLEQLAVRSDVLLGLATGNIERGARIKLARGNLNRYFSFGGFGSDSENRTALVRRAADVAVGKNSVLGSNDIFVIGDTPRDVDAGRDAGFRTVGVATGQYTVEELRQCGADIVIPDFREGRDYFLRSTFIV